MKYILLIVAGLLISGCSFFAHHRDVRPDAEGVHKVILNTDDRQSGYREAKSQADHFCKSQNKTPLIINEDYKYVGSLTESDYAMLKTAAKVVKSAGGAAWLWGNKQSTRDSGGATAIGGEIADDAIGAGYYYTVTFKCQ